VRIEPERIARRVVPRDNEVVADRLHDVAISWKSGRIDVGGSGRFAATEEKMPAGWQVLRLICNRQFRSRRRLHVVLQLFGGVGLHRQRICRNDNRSEGLAIANEFNRVGGSGIGQNSEAYEHRCALYPGEFSYSFREHALEHDFRALPFKLESRLPHFAHINNVADRVPAEVAHVIAVDSRR
jgi:hypothetical protein